MKVLIALLVLFFGIGFLWGTQVNAHDATQIQEHQIILERHNQQLQEDIKAIQKLITTTRNHKYSISQLYETQLSIIAALDGILKQMNEYHRQIIIDKGEII